VAVAAVAIGVGFAAVTVPTAIARRDYNLMPPRTAEAVDCDDLGGDFYFDPWRVPDQYFGGYHCLFPGQNLTPGQPVVPLDVADPRFTEAARHCATHPNASFTDIASFVYVGYACTWAL